MATDLPNSERATEVVSTGLLAAVSPPPPKGISYVLGNESWKDAKDRTPVRLHVEEWGNLGPMELNPEIKPNAAGFRVRSTEILAPPGAYGVEEVGGVLYWSTRDVWGREHSANKADMPTCTPKE